MECVVKLRFRKLARNPFARNDGRVSRNEVKLRFERSKRNPFVRNGGRVSKTGVKAFVCKRVCA